MWSRSWIDDYVETNREEAIGLLRKLVDIPSPTGEEYEIGYEVKKLLEEDALPAEICAKDPMRPNVLSTWIGNKHGKRFLLNGHYDVFPPDTEKNPEAWKSFIKNGMLYGCGTSDMKAGLAAAIVAVKFLKRSGFVPNGTIILSCDCDEEQGGNFGVRYLIGKDLLSADFGVCMEASENYVISESDGRIAYRITYCAESRHAGLRGERKSAIEKACIAMAAIRNYDQRLKKYRSFPDTQTGAIASVTEIKAGNIGESPNMHAASCSFSVDRRYTRGETIESATKELRKLLDELQLEDEEMVYELEITESGPQLSMDQQDPFLDLCIDAYDNFFGKKITKGRRCGGGDTAKITDAYGFCLPQFGPGRFDQLCSPTEHVSIDEYVGFIKIYMDLIIKTLG